MIITLTTPDEKSFRFVEQVLFEKGYDWAYNNPRQRKYGGFDINKIENPVINTEDGNIWINLSAGKFKQNDKYIDSITELVNLPKFEPPIKIQNYIVEFLEVGNIKIGCEIIPWTKIELIYNKAKVNHDF